MFERDSSCCTRSIAPAMMKRPAAATVTEPKDVEAKRQRVLKALVSDTSVADSDFAAETGTIKFHDTEIVECKTCGLQMLPSSMSSWIPAGRCSSCGGTKFRERSDVEAHMWQ